MLFNLVHVVKPFIISYDLDDSPGSLYILKQIHFMPYTYFEQL